MSWKTASTQSRTSPQLPACPAVPWAVPHCLTPGLCPHGCGRLVVQLFVQPHDTAPVGKSFTHRGSSAHRTAATLVPSLQGQPGFLRAGKWRGPAWSRAHQRWAPRLHFPCREFSPPTESPGLLEAEYLRVSLGRRVGGSSEKSGRDIYLGYLKLLWSNCLYAMYSYQIPMHERRATTGTSPLLCSRTMMPTAELPVQPAGTACSDFFFED